MLIKLNEVFSIFQIKYLISDKDVSIPAINNCQKPFLWILKSFTRNLVLYIQEKFSTLPCMLMIWNAYFMTTHSRCQNTYSNKLRIFSQLYTLKHPLNYYEFKRVLHRHFNVNIFKYLLSTVIDWKNVFARKITSKRVKFLNCMSLLDLIIVPFKNTFFWR